MTKTPKPKSPTPIQIELDAAIAILNSLCTDFPLAGMTAFGELYKTQVHVSHLVNQLTIVASREA